MASIAIMVMRIKIALSRASREAKGNLDFLDFPTASILSSNLTANLCDVVHILYRSQDTTVYHIGLRGHFP